MTTGMGAHHKPTPTSSTIWLTPPSILRALGLFDLDPCAVSKPRPWDTAETHYALPEDGLSREWRGRVWLNPPYGRKMGVWLERLKEHGDGIALLFARTGTDDWFQYIWNGASSILFIYGRIDFYLPDGTRGPGNAGAPSALIAYGENNTIALRQSGIRGKLVVVDV